jgi:hypothetical protein
MIHKYFILLLCDLAGFPMNVVQENSVRFGALFTKLSTGAGSVGKSTWFTGT